MTAQVKWIDTHSHLTDKAFKDDLSAVLDRARHAGVAKFIVNAWDKRSIDQVLLLAVQEQDVYCTVGIHPSDWQDLDESGISYIKSLAKDAKQNKIVAIGEVGMDYHYDGIDKDGQKKAFRQQIEIAHEFNLPLVVHERDAHGDAIELLIEAKADGVLLDQPGVFHCYSGTAEFAQRLIPQGWFFGFDGPLTYKNGKKAREAVLAIPKDKILIETDAPYLAPQAYRGKRNEPSFLPEVAKTLATLWDLNMEETSRQLWQNSHACFPNLS